VVTQLVLSLLNFSDPMRESGEQHHSIMCLQHMPVFCVLAGDRKVTGAALTLEATRAAAAGEFDPEALEGCRVDRKVDTGASADSYCSTLR
jgi:hypothetical protein